jgi:hypothetical protein
MDYITQMRSRTVSFSNQLIVGSCVCWTGLVDLGIDVVSHSVGPRGRAHTYVAPAHLVGVSPHYSIRIDHASTRGSYDSIVSEVGSGDRLLYIVIGLVNRLLDNYIVIVSEKIRLPVI